MQNDKLLKYKVWESSKGKKSIHNKLFMHIFYYSMLAVYNAFSYLPIEPCCCC